MSDSPAVAPMFCPRCAKTCPGDEFTLQAIAIAAASTAPWSVDVLRHKPCRTMVWRPAKERVAR